MKPKGELLQLENVKIWLQCSTVFLGKRKWTGKKLSIFIQNANKEHSTTAKGFGFLLVNKQNVISTIRQVKI